MAAARARVCVVGAGAIGGFFAARLAHAGYGVSLLARGKTLEAIRRHGLRFESGSERYAVEVRASERAGDLGPQDVVFVSVKAPALAEAAKLVPALLEADTIVVPTQNGLPWWFFLPGGAALSGRRLRTVDPEGAIEAAIPLERVVGAVVFPSCSCPEPGLVRHASGTRLVFGEPSGGASARVGGLVRLLQEAGLAAEESDAIRREYWLKVLGNGCWNPVSLLIGTPTDAMIDDPRLHALFTSMMEEIIALGRRIGIETEVRPAERIALTRKLGSVKTSMLQDVEAGRAVEIDAIAGVLVETAEAVGFPAPLLGALYALARMRASVLGLY